MEYKKRLGEKVAEKRAFEQEQQKLRRKYKIHEDGRSGKKDIPAYRCFISAVRMWRAECK